MDSTSPWIRGLSTLLIAECNPAPITGYKTRHINTEKDSNPTSYNLTLSLVYPIPPRQHVPHTHPVCITDQPRHRHFVENYCWSKQTTQSRSVSHSKRSVPQKWPTPLSSTHRLTFALPLCVSAVPVHPRTKMRRLVLGRQIHGLPVRSSSPTANA